MRVAVTGKTGQIASSLVERGRAAGHQVIALGRPEFDLAVSSSVSTALDAVRPDVVISAAAYTAVDKAETEPGIANIVNVDGPIAIARAARALQIPLIHISTDYVFDGLLQRPYVESDSPRPTSVYGASKLGGEKGVLAEYADGSAVVRVAWVYSPFGSNFVKTMLRIAKERDEISVVEDQLGNPTSALDIADGLLQVAANLISHQDPQLRGIFHMAAAGEASWAEFANQIFTESKARGGPHAKVKSIKSIDYPTAAVRPQNSRLNCDAIAKVHGVTLPHWQSALKAVISRL